MNKKDNYDTIIENLTKEWEASMDCKIIKDRWEVPKYSGKKIKNAGIIISNPNILPENKQESLEILNNWRSSHAYPLNAIANNLRLSNPDAIVVQRLKRLESITHKLERFPDMNLYRMQDLGGCRVIMNSIEEIYFAINKYKNSRIRHILKREYDYVQKPKQSGYRSYHMVYQFQSITKEEYNKNILVEIQFRTKNQHIWATAVEIMGIYTKSHLKSNIGDKEVLRFFALVSSIFAIMDKTPIIPNTSDNINELIDEVRQLDKNLNIIKRLTALSTAIHHIANTDDYTKSGYFLLHPDYEHKTIRIDFFPEKEIKHATNVYSQLEKLNIANTDVVLVSAESFDALKLAYPNYFTDISGFIYMMSIILSEKF